MRAHFGLLAFSTPRILILIAVAAFVLAAMLSVSPALGAEVTVLSGDTFQLETTSWRIANIDAPRTEKTCADEARLGALAQAKLAEFLNQGEMEIAPTGGSDRYAAKLALVRMNGEDVGEKMIAAGLAQRHGRARALCVGMHNLRDELRPTDLSRNPMGMSSPHMN